MKIPIFQIDAFTNELFKGNPAAVCPLEAWLSDSILQSIAEENNLSETAFYLKNEKGYEIRWFTPNKEVDLCGHATIAAAYVIFEKTAFMGDEIIFSSKSGELKVQKKKDHYILNFPSQKAEECKTPDALIQGLGIPPKKCYKASDYMAVFENEADIRSIKPDFQKLKELDLRGLIITATGNNVDFVSRFFAPKYGINEDPVTGSAHCTLAPYWSEKLKKTSLSAIQCSQRGGTLACEVKFDRIFISGKATLYLEGSISI